MVQAKCWKITCVTKSIHSKLFPPHPRYMFGSVTQDQLVAFYRDAQVALITPLRDGMNLVAKEFVASQNDEDPGVLVLSPFAGAGGLMQEALQVKRRVMFVLKHMLISVQMQMSFICLICNIRTVRRRRSRNRL